MNLLALIVSLLLAEPLTHLAHLLVLGSWFPTDEYRGSMERVIEQTSLIFGEHVEDGERGLGKAAIQVIHPYLGFVHDHGIEADTSEHGFPLSAPSRPDGGQPARPDVEMPAGPEPGSGTGQGHGIEPPAEPQPIRVAVLGGSFAAGLATVAGGDLADELSGLGRPVEIVNLAMGGYKQPQQLMALTYMLSLGEQYSIVLNIDGFNEVVLPGAHNSATGIHPHFPLRWAARVANVRPTRLVKGLARVELCDRARARWAKVYVRTGAHRSALLCLVWRARDSWLRHRREALADESATAIALSGSSFASAGPSYQWPQDAAGLAEQLADHWYRCSLQMAAMCEASGSIYIHVLQPNQYVEGSKPMGEVEQRIALNPDHPYRSGALAGYPMLIERGSSLQAEGVRFLDLTMVFESIVHQVYVDDCCHVNRYGYRQLIGQIGEVARQALGEDRGV